MANVCCSPENENGMVCEEITRLTKMVQNLRPRNFDDLISHIEGSLKDIVIANNIRGTGVETSTKLGDDSKSKDGLNKNNMDIANPPQNIPEMGVEISTNLGHDSVSHIKSEDGSNENNTDIANPPENMPGSVVRTSRKHGRDKSRAGVDMFDIVKCSTEFGRALLQYVLIKTCAGRKVCSPEKLRYEAQKVVSCVVKEAQHMSWMAVGLSVVAHMMDEMKKDSSKGSVYVQHLLYMLGLLKYIRQQRLMQETKPKLLEDVVYFIVFGSLLCIVRMRSKNLCGWFSASTNKAYIDNLEFRLGYIYPHDLTLAQILDKFPTTVPRSQEQHYVNADAVGIEKARDEVIMLFEEGEDGVVITGQDGIGKTTIGNAVFNSIQQRLTNYDFFRLEIKHRNSQHDIKILQQQLLRDFFGKDIVLRGCREGAAHLTNAFTEATKPVFIFIDNLQGVNVDNLLPFWIFEIPGNSKILITTTQPLQFGLERFYMTDYSVRGLDRSEAKNLLCKEVLGSAEANFSRKVNIDNLTSMCNGIPLALRMAASYLRQNGDHVSACNHLLQSIQKSDICGSIVDFIYSRLEERYKEAFLDMAIFFNNWERHKVVYTFPDIQVKVLEDVGLIMISSQGKLLVHNVVRERAIAFSGNSRITDGQQLKDAFNDEPNLSKIKGIWLSEGLSEFQLEAGHLDKMSKSLRVLYLGKSIKVSGECNSMFEEVRFFHIYNKHDLPMDLHNFKQAAFFHGSLKKEIDFLDLTHYLHLLEVTGVSDLTKIPSGLQLAKSLHVLKLSDSPGLDTLPEGFTFFSSLEELDLSNCVNLRDLPSQLDQFKSLCKLKLTACSNLKTLPETLCDLSSLEGMDCTDCSNLVGLPASFGQLQSLYYLKLRGCSELVSLPESFGNLSCLEELDLSSCKKLKILPHSFHKLNSLSHLHLQSCSEFNVLPQNFGNLSALEELDLSSDDKLESVESSFGQLESLRHLQLQGCSNLISLPQNIGNLSSLEDLDLSGCENLSSLPDSFGQLKSLRVLKLCCSNLTELPLSMGDMSSLEQMTLTNCERLTRLPNTLSQLKSLNRMNLEGCSEFTEILLPSLEKLEMTGCSKLVKLPDHIIDKDSLRELKLHGCSALSELPPMFAEEYGNCLEDLVLNGCESLKALPASFSSLKYLHHLGLRGASKLTTDSVSAFSTSLETLDLGECSSLQRLPQRFEKCKNLTLLLLDRCSKLSALPDGFGKLYELRYLSIAGCTELQELPPDFVELNSLEGMNASGCSALQGHAMDLLVGTKSLRFADIRESPMLIGRWNEIPMENKDMLVLWSDSRPETMYRDVIFRIWEPFELSSRKALVWLKWHGQDFKSEQIMEKVHELQSKYDLDFVEVNFIKDQLIMSNRVTSPWQRNGKICRTLLYAILRLWNLRDPGSFPTLEMLEGFLVMIDIPKRSEEGEVQMEAIIPAFQNGGYQDVDVDPWIDTSLDGGGFRDFLSPYVVWVLENVEEGKASGQIRG